MVRWDGSLQQAHLTHSGCVRGGDSTHRISRGMEVWVESLAGQEVRGRCSDPGRS